jgi:uncharacterized membrane protein (Fun14 family)
VTQYKPFDDFIFSLGGGFLFGAVAEYAIKKVMKIAAVVIGLFVAKLSADHGGVLMFSCN